MPRFFRPVLASVACALVISACGGVTTKYDGKLPAPPTTVELPDAIVGTERATDTSGIQLDAVPGDAPKDRIQITGGTATISGKLQASNGPVANATITIERFVDSRSVAITVSSNESGDFRVSNVRGGRYRIRAWRVPDAVFSEAVVDFIAEGTNANYTIDMQLISGISLQAVASPSSAYVDDQVNVGVKLTQRSVGSDGVVRAVGVAGATVSISNVTHSQLLTGQVATLALNASGEAQWSLLCTQSGALTLSLAYGVAAGGATSTTADTYSVSTCVAKPAP